MRSAVAIAALAPLMCGGCVAIGLAASEALVVGGLGAAAVAVAVDDGKPPGVKIYGNYAAESGFWFDRDLYSVWVVSDTAESSERHAYAAAAEACVRKERALQVVRENAWREYGLFIPIPLDRYSCELRYRCATDRAAVY